MENSSKFYMVKKKALPEILLKVAEANALLNLSLIHILSNSESYGVGITF